jgi:hypothetical protein
MARPKKTIEPAEIIQVEVAKSVSPVLEAIAEPETKQVAFSFYKVVTPEGKLSRWEVTKIQFDAATGFTKRPEVVRVCESEAEALNLFKVNVSQTIFKNNR